MDDRRFTWSYLKSLATYELMVLADSYGIDIPPDLERNFIIEELLEIEAERNLDEDLEDSDIPEPAPLPKLYNITYINTLIRNPLWVFAFWEIKIADKESLEKAEDFEGYFLRITGITQDISFTIPVGIADNAWYLGFPPEIGGGRFIVEICVRRGVTDMVLGASKDFQLPPLFSRPEEDEIDNPLSLISGLGDLPILHNADRFPYVPRKWNSKAGVDE